MGIVPSRSPMRNTSSSLRTIASVSETTDSAASSGAGVVVRCRFVGSDTALGAGAPCRGVLNVAGRRRCPRRMVLFPVRSSVDTPGSSIDREAGARMRIAMLAPPWIPVPAPAYGGIEEVVRLLCEGLVDRGHAVTLFAPPASSSPAVVRPVLEDAHPDEIERARWEVDHVAPAFEAIDREAERDAPFSVVHDHCGFSALAMADRLDTPLVHTLHGPFAEDTLAFYRQHGCKGTIVAISHAQLADAPPELGDAHVVHNPLNFDEWRLSTEPRDHVLWVGRMSPVKGPHRAIEAARRADVPLVLAGPVQPGQEEFFAREV